MTKIEKPAEDWRLTDKRHDEELWAFEYDNTPYLESITDEELDQRYNDIMNNVEHLVCPLRDTAPEHANFISSWWWLKIKFQTEYEYSRRKRVLLKLNAPRPIPTNPVHCTPATPSEAKFIVRYGESQWLEPMLKEGNIWISPASRYKSEVPVADSARHADELNNHSYISGKRLQVTLLSTGQAIPVIGNMKRTTSMAYDYYVLCCSQEFDYRLFSAFRNEEGNAADACLIINEVDEFAKRLNGAVQEMLKSWYFHHNPVRYYDPCNVGRNQKPNPGAIKDFKYAYQREYRFLWDPLSPGTRLTDILKVRIGSLEDIATIQYCHI